MSIINNKWYLDGVEFDPNAESQEPEELEKKTIQLVINGNVDTINSDNITSVTVKGDAGSISTVSGDVVCSNVSGNVSTVSGDIDVNIIDGNANTVSGDIRYRR